MSAGCIIELGPLLGVESDDEYTICVLIQVYDDSLLQEISLLLNNKKYEAKYCEPVRTHFYFLRFAVKLPLPAGNHDDFVTYQVLFRDEPMGTKFDMSTFTFRVPHTNRIPRVAFVSCNGAHDKYPDAIESDAYRGWDKLLTEKVDLLFLTGDQVYADTLWSRTRGPLWSLRLFGKLWSSAMQEQVDIFFFNLYIDSWSNTSMATALATIPNVMTWDDHDIIDGYGSHPDWIQNSNLLQGIFNVAARYYELFQVRTHHNTSLLKNKSGYTAYFNYRNFSFVLPDTRSFRSKTSILGPNGIDILRAIKDKLKLSAYTYYGIEKNMNVICFVLPVPIAHRNFNTPFEKAHKFISGSFMKLLPGWVKISLSDDLVDHWDHELHVKEYADMLNLMFEYGEKHKPYSILVASGDVHSGGAAAIVSGERAICQLISSPIVNEPSGLMLRLLADYLAKDRNIVAGCVVTDFKKFGNAVEAVFDKRNFITVCDDIGVEEVAADSEEAVELNLDDLPTVVNDETVNLPVPASRGRRKSGKLIASLFLEPWNEEPFYRTINKFI